MYEPTDSSGAEMNLSAVWGKMCRERFYVEETFRWMADVKCFVNGGGKAKTACQGVCVIAHQGVSAALGLHVVLAAEYLPQS